MGPGRGERKRTAQEALLLHPSRDDVRPCTLVVTRRGVVVRPPSAPAVRIPWWATEGFAADGMASAPDGTVRQVLQIVTDAGTLSLLLPAPDLSVLLAQVGRRSAQWRRSRRPALAAAARFATVVMGVVALPVASLVVNALGGLGLAVAGKVVPVVRAAFRTGARVAGRWPVAAGATGLSVALGVVLLAVTGAQAVPALPAARAAETHPFDVSGMARMAMLGSQGALNLAAATAAPQPAPASLADQPPMLPHEVFGFAPYWTLDQSTGFPVQGLTTIAYFALDVNANGTLDESGPGWEGYESQALANLVTRAYAAGDRVVLTVDDFDQSSLDQLTSSPAAATTLAAAVVSAIQAKNLDGVNLDFEGQGSSDQAGLTALVGAVSAAVHAADPHYQVTMDTYASAAGDPTGFYDIPALAPEVDGFFVMAYDLNLGAVPTDASPLTSAMFNDVTTLQQYTAVVPTSKIILGLPYYGYSWPTTNGTMAATAAGGATPVTVSQVLTGGHTLYWDPVTETAWTSYQVGGQWYEAYVMNPTSIYLATQLAQSYGVDGVGAWALGMDGNDPTMIGALDGVAPPSDTVPGPLGTPGAAPPAAATTPISGTAAAASPTTATPTTAAGTPTTIPVSGSTGAEPAGGSTTVPPSSTTSTTTTVDPPTTSTTVPAYRYTGTWQGEQVSLRLVPTTTPVPSGTPQLLGTLTGFATDDPALDCLASATALQVWSYGTTTPGDVVTATQPADCATARFTFPATGS